MHFIYVVNCDFLLAFFGRFSSFDGSAREVASSSGTGIAVSAPDTCTRSGTEGHGRLDSLLAFSSLTPLNICSSRTSALSLDSEN